MHQLIPHAEKFSLEMYSRIAKAVLLKQVRDSAAMDDGNTIGGGDWDVINSLNRVTFDENEGNIDLEDRLGAIADEFAAEAKKLAEKRKLTQGNTQRETNNRSYWPQSRRTLLEIIPEETEETEEIEELVIPEETAPERNENDIILEDVEGETVPEMDIAITDSSGSGDESSRRDTIVVRPMEAFIPAWEETTPVKKTKMQKIAAFFCIAAPADHEARRESKGPDSKSDIVSEHKDNATEKKSVIPKPLIKWYKNMKRFILK